jgi:hypothetical protein
METADVLGYIGMSLVMSGFFLISGKGKGIKCFGFGLNGVGAVILLLQAVMLNLMPIMLLNAFMIVMNVRGIATNLKK